MTGDAGNPRYDELDELDRQIWEQTHARTRDAGSVRAWAQRLARAVDAGIVTEHEARGALARARRKGTT